MSDVSYPLDLTGNSPANLIPNELHTVSEANYRDYFFIVPNFAPFYVDNFQLIYMLDGNERILEEGVDFNFALPYVAGIRSVGKLLYGAVTLNNLDIAGITRMRYQTLGGEWIVDRLKVLQTLAEKVYNPRTTIWDVITDKPEIFPPIPHYQDYDNFYSQYDLIQAIQNIANNIALYKDESAIVRHLTNTNNPHQVSLEQLGIPDVENWHIANESEIDTGNESLAIISTVGLAYLKNQITQHINNVDQRASLALQALHDYIAIDRTGFPAFTLLPEFTDISDSVNITFDSVRAVVKTYYWKIEHITTTPNMFINQQDNFITDETGAASFTVQINIDEAIAGSQFKIVACLGGFAGPVFVKTDILTLVD